MKIVWKVGLSWVKQAVAMTPNLDHLKFTSGCRRRGASAVPCSFRSERLLPAWARLPGVVACSYVLASCLSQPAVSDPILKNPEEVRRIDEAIPQQALANPAKPRKLLLFCLNVGYGGHPSIDYANQAFQLMGQKTGAFEVVISRDPAVFQRESLQQFDAVFFNNTVGNCFTDPELRRNLAEFVFGGGGLLGVHGTTVAFTRWPGAIEDWPEFGLMIGARGANHRESTEHVFIKLDDPSHPVNHTFGPDGFDYRDEFFRVQDPYSRRRVRVLFSIDTARTEPNQGRGFGYLVRPDNDYALAWVRNYGRGRVFYCTIAHNPYVFWDPKMLQFYLGAIQFALGDLPAPTTPSGFLTPAVRAQERLGWRLGSMPSTFSNETLFDAIDKAGQLKILYLGCARFQKVSRDLPKNLDANLSAEDFKQIRLKLDSTGVRLLTYEAGPIPADETGCRRLFALGRKLGVETLIGTAQPEALDLVEKLGLEYDIAFALQPPSKTRSWDPSDGLRACENRGRSIGLYAHLGYWLRAGIDPVQGVRKLGTRLRVAELHDLSETAATGRDVVWGTGQGKIEPVLRAMAESGAKPTVISLPSEHSSSPALDLSRCIEFFDSVTMGLAK